MRPSVVERLEAEVVEIGVDERRLAHSSLAKQEDVDL